MAFVFRSEKVASHIKDNTNEMIGPGSYVGHEERQKTKTFAPFNSSEARNEKVPKQQELSPGPGHYQIDRGNNNEKVVVSSQNEDIKIVEVPKPQSVFKSQSKRFDKPKSMHENPGPGSYQPPDQFPRIKGNSLHQNNQTKEKQNIIDHLMKINKYQSIPSIPGKMHAFGYTENENNDLELNKLPQYQNQNKTDTLLGPGQYNTKDTFEKNKDKGPTWSKYQQARMDHKMPEIPGAGQYDVSGQYNPLYKLKQSSGFASRTLRTSDTRKGMIANKFIKQRDIKSVETTSRITQAETGVDSDSEYEYIDDTTPGPGHYDSQSVISAIRPQAKQDKFQFFGSSQDRFKDSNQKKGTSLGPGNYDVEKNLAIGKNSKTYVPKNPPFLSSNTRFEMKTVSEGQVPAPGQYDTRMSGYRGNFGCTERRFKSMSVVEEQPGPGSYLEVIPEKDGEEVNPTMVFKSKQPRDVFKKQKEPRPPIGAYELNYYDINNQLNKDEEEDEDLKIHRPGFMSDEPRFNWQKAEKKKELQKKLGDNQDDDEESVIYTKDKDITDLFKSKNKKQGAPFNSKQQRFNYRPKSKIPGPGEYHDPNVNNWNKRTYNILFAEI